MSNGVLDLIMKGIDEIKGTLVSIEDRLRQVEETLAENRGRQKGFVSAKDIFVVICSIAAVVISYIRLSQ